MKFEKLKRGDAVGVVSLSSGVLGESFVAHEVKLLEERLTQKFELKVKYMNNVRKGIEFLREHPEARAEDLRQAFLDEEVKIIWSAIGGNDAIRLAPYILTEEFGEVILKNPKIFMGFSDTTNIHLMLYKAGLPTLYGPALLPDVAELGPEMLPYTEGWIKGLFEGVKVGGLGFKETEKGVEVLNSSVWYKAREKFDESQVGVAAEEMKEERGFMWLGDLSAQEVKGKLLGGCIDSLYKMIKVEEGEFEGVEDLKGWVKKQGGRVFPEREEWKGKVLFIESSDGCPEPELYKKFIQSLENKGVFEEVKGILAGKPMDEKYFAEYAEVLDLVGKEYGLPVVYNMNFGHATPRMILPYGREAEIDVERRKVTLAEGILG